MAKRKVVGSRGENARLAQHLQETTLALRQIANSLGFMILHMSDLKEKSNTEKMPLLTSLGFDRKAIAAILRTTPQTVSVTLSKMKAGPPAPKGAKQGKKEEKQKTKSPR